MYCKQTLTMSVLSKSETTDWMLEALASAIPNNVERHVRVVQINAILMSAFDFTVRVKALETGWLVKPPHCCSSLADCGV